MNPDEKVRAAAKSGDPVDLAGAELPATTLSDILGASPDSKSLHRLGLTLTSATITGPLDLRNTEVAAQLSFIGCEFQAEVDLTDATTRSVTLEDTEFRKGLKADRLNVKGSLYFDRGTVSYDGVRLLSAHISNNLYCIGATFHPPSIDDVPADTRDDEPEASAERPCFIADGLRVDGTLWWGSHPEPEAGQERGPVTTAHGAVRLVGAHVGSLIDDLDCWPTRVRQKGFVYERLMSAPSERQLSGRIALLRRSPKPGDSWRKRFKDPDIDHVNFSPQPYQQLASVYRDLGRESDAHKVLRTRWSDELRLGPSGWRMIGAWLRRSLLQVTVGNGYAPWRALWFFGLFFVIGCFLVTAGVDGDHFVASSLPAEGPSPDPGACTANYECLNPSLYVLDVLTPFDLGATDAWRVDDSDGSYGSMALAVGRALGWALSLTLAASFTPLIRKS